MSNEYSQKNNETVNYLVSLTSHEIMRPAGTKSKYSHHAVGGGTSSRFGCILLSVAIFFLLVYGFVIARILSNKSLSSESSSLSESFSTSSHATTQNRITPKIMATEETDKSGIDIDFDAVTAVVECDTTHGPLTIDIHKHWGPLGTEQYLSLVDQGFFTDLPFFRVAPRYITQFGAKLKAHDEAKVQTIKDDESLWGKRDIDFGYLFFAGNGPNSRHDQMVIALCEKPGCISTKLGKAPWEVPIGSVRQNNFETLKSIAKTGYPYPKLEMPSQHRNGGGPDQLKIRTDPQYLRDKYPDMAYWKNCKVVRRDIDIGHSISKSKETELHQKNAEEEGVLVRFDVEFMHDNIEHETGYFIVEIMPHWAPLGAQRFLEMVESEFFDNCRFFRALKNFMAQFGIGPDPKSSAYWRARPIPDDPVRVSNERGYLSFAMAGKNTRSSQIFINFVKNSYLDKEGFAPFARVVEGMDVIDKIYTGYGEGGNGKGTDGRGPKQGLINQKGEKYLEEVFPKLTIIRKVRILK